MGLPPPGDPVKKWKRNTDKTRNRASVIGTGDKREMNRSRVFVAALVGLLIAVALAGCASKTQNNQGAAAAATGEAIHTNVGEDFQVSLLSNPSTGYEWSMTTRPDPKVASQKGNEFTVPSRTKEAGAPGQEVWTFEAIGPGRTIAVFENVRASGSSAQPVQNHKVLIIVAPAPATPQPPARTYSNPGIPIVETVGRGFQIDVSDQSPSTGYQWVVSPDFNHKVCVFEGVNYVSRPNDPSGTHQTEVWRFEAVGSGNTLLTFDYVKPEDPTAPPAKTLRFAVSVN